METNTKVNFNFSGSETSANEIDENKITIKGKVENGCFQMMDIGQIHEEREPNQENDSKFQSNFLSVPIDIQDNKEISNDEVAYEKIAEVEKLTLTPQQKKEQDNKIQNERFIGDEVNERICLNMISNDTLHSLSNGSFEILVNHIAPITSITISDDREYILTGSLDRTCRVLKKKQIEQNYTLEATSSLGNKDFNDSIWSLKCARDKNTNDLVAIAGDNNGRLHCWDLRTNQKKWKSESSGNFISQIIINQNENQDLIASTGGDNKVRFWDISLPLTLMPSRHTISSNCNVVTSIAFNSLNLEVNEYLSNSKNYSHIILTGGHPSRLNVLEIWDLETLKSTCYKRFESVRKPHKLATSNCGKFALVSLFDSSRIHVFDLTTSEMVKTIRQKGTGGVLDMVISSDFVVVCGINKFVEVWNWKTGQKVDSICQHDSWVRGLLYDYQSEFIFSVGSDPSRIVVSPWTFSNSINVSNL